MSGAEQPQAAAEMKELLHSKYPNLTSAVHIKGDTFGSIATCVESGELLYNALLTPRRYWKNTLLIISLKAQAQIDVYLTGCRLDIL